MGLTVQCWLKDLRRKSVWLVAQENVKVRCRKEECGGIAYHCPFIPHSYKEDSLDLQMLFSTPKYDSEEKKKKRGKKS